MFIRFSHKKGKKLIKSRTASNPFKIDFILYNIRSISGSCLEDREALGMEDTVSLSSVNRTNIKISTAGNKPRDQCFLPPARCRCRLFLSGCWGWARPAENLRNSVQLRGMEMDEWQKAISRCSTLKRNSMPAPVDICFHRCAHPMWLRLALHTTTTTPQKCCLGTPKLCVLGHGCETRGTVVPFWSRWNWWWEFDWKGRRKWKWKWIIHCKEMRNWT